MQTEKQKPIASGRPSQTTPASSGPQMILCASAETSQQMHSKKQAAVGIKASAQSPTGLPKTAGLHTMARGPGQCRRNSCGLRSKGSVE